MGGWSFDADTSQRCAQTHSRSLLNVDSIAIHGTLGTHLCGAVRCRRRLVHMLPVHTWRRRWRGILCDRGLFPTAIAGSPRNDTRLPLPSRCARSNHQRSESPGRKRGAGSVGDTFVYKSQRLVLPRSPARAASFRDFLPPLIRSSR